MKQITVTERVFNAFHNWLIVTRQYLFVDDVYYRHRSKALKRNGKGKMNEPMAREFRHFLNDYLKHGKEFIEVLL